MRGLGFCKDGLSKGGTALSVTAREFIKWLAVKERAKAIDAEDEKNVRNEEVEHWHCWSAV